MKNHHSHVLIMFLCCLAPILAIIILSRYFNFGNFTFLLILLCPLAHIVLMKLIMKNPAKGAKEKTKNSCH